MFNPSFSPLTIAYYLFTIAADQGQKKTLAGGYSPIVVKKQQKTTVCRLLFTFAPKLLYGLLTPHFLL